MKCNSCPHLEPLAPVFTHVQVMHFLIVDPRLPTASSLTEWLGTAPTLDALTCLRDPPLPLLAQLHALAPPAEQPALQRVGARRFHHDSRRTLSPRLLEVEAQLLRGTPNKVIARELSLSDHTIKEYVSAVLAHHGVRNRLELVLHARNRTSATVAHWSMAAT